MHSSKIVSLMLFLALLGACNPPELNEDAPDATGLSGDAPSLWPSARFPLNLKISDDFTSGERAAIQEMGNLWEVATSSTYNFFNLDQESTIVPHQSLASYQDGEFGIYKATNWFANLPLNALAITQLFGMRRNIGTPSYFIEITHADIIMNEQGYNFSLGVEPAGSFDLPTVMLHEMGHFLGLYHNYNYYQVDTIMQPSISSTTVIREVFPSDRENLRALYPWQESNLALSASQGGQRFARRQQRFAPGETQGVTPTAPDEPVQIILELYPGGLCLHRHNGVVEKIHSIN